MLTFEKPVVLLGNGEFKPEILTEVLTFTSFVVAADGGAKNAVLSGITPKAIIGDFDSVETDTLKGVAKTAQIKVDDQDTTDFEKCLELVKAPLLLAVGFTGRRMDHTLAVMSALAQNLDKRCIVVGSDDVILSLPPKIEFDLPVGTRFSLFPFADVTGTSVGLKWSIDGLAMSPMRQIGTSNETSAARQVLTVSGPGMLAMFPREFLANAIRALGG